jgi:hypothetical protein
LGSLTADNDTGYQNDWSQNMRAEYPLADLSFIDEGDLFDENKQNEQVYYFYDDSKENKDPNTWDGHHSFKSFMSQYGVKADFGRDGTVFPIQEVNEKNKTVKDHGAFVTITLRHDSGRSITIYANKPDHEKEIELMDQAREDTNVESTITVHRGHSYHASKTLKKVTESSVLVPLGSCGGNSNISKVLSSSAEAHVISTKGTGVKLVNDELLVMLNEYILENGSIHWESFWKELEAKFGNNKDFKNYIPPYKNKGLAFISEYARLTKKKSEK